MWRDPRKLVTLAFLAAVVVPNLVAIAIPIEVWPYTNAPMFAHRVSPDTPRYAFVFEGRRLDGSTVELGYYSAAARWSLLRFFFKYVYGAAPAGEVFCAFPDDSLERMERRLSDFFAVFVERYHERYRGEARLAEVVLELARLQGPDNDRIETRRLGVFDVATGSYSHQWGAGS